MLYEATCIELNLSPDYDVVLDEAGGIISVLARAYTGKDADLPKQIEEELDKVTTEEHHKKLLDEVDKFIREANGNHHFGSGGFPKELEPSTIAWPGSTLYNKRMAWLAHHGQNKLNAVRGAGTVIGQLAALAVTRANAQDGTLKKYIADLTKVRAKIAAHKIPKESDK